MYWWGGHLQGAKKPKKKQAYLRQLLFSKSHCSTRNDHALAAAVLQLGHLLHDGGQATQGDALAVFTGDDRATDLDNNSLQRSEIAN
jgi:hypothetical protein